MSVKKLFAILSVPVLLLTACEKEFKIPLPKTDYKPVLNALLSQDSLVYVRVSMPARPQSGGITDPDKATVMLYEDGVFKETLEPSNSSGKKYYISKGRVVAGHQYRITVQVPDYNMVEGTDLIPDRGTYAISAKNSYMAMGSDNEQELNLNFSLIHNGSGKGYYQYRVYAYTRVVSTIVGEDTTWREERQLKYFRDKNQTSGLFGNSDGYTDATGNILENRVLAPGETAQITLVSTNGFYDQADSLQVEISQLSEPCHKYLQSLRTAMNSDDDPTAEKAILYSNIMNGFGIVGAMTTKQEFFVRP